MLSQNLLARIADPYVANPGAAYMQGVEGGNYLAKLRDQSAARELLPGAMGGDKNALARLAGVDPDMALRLDDRSYQRGRDAVADRRAAASEGRAAASADREAQVAYVRRVANVVSQAQTPEAWDRAMMYLKGQGVDTSQLRFEDREMLIAEASDIVSRIGKGDDLIPKGYRQSATGGLEFIPGGPEDPAVLERIAKAKGSGRSGAQTLTTTDKKAILEADEGVMAGENVISAIDQALALNDKAYTGWLAKERGDITSLFGSEEGAATSRVSNLVTGQALEQLKAIFGGMPTEGERKILLDIQGSVNQAPEVRKAIWERAKQLAERRIAFNKDRASQLRSGSYYEPQGGNAPPQEAVNELLSDPSPEAIAEFNEVFGEGAAEQLLGGQ